MKWWRLRPYRMNSIACEQAVTWLGKFLTSVFGAPETNRTPDLLSTKQLLYQLSYKGIGETGGTRTLTPMAADFKSAAATDYATVSFNMLLL